MDADRAREITHAAARKITDAVVLKIYDLVEPSAKMCCTETSINIDDLIWSSVKDKSSKLDFKLVRQFINTTLVCDGYTVKYSDDDEMIISWSLSS